VREQLFFDLGCTCGHVQRPQPGVQPDFELRDRRKIGPGVTGKHFGDGGMVDAGYKFHISQASVADGGQHVHGEFSGDFTDDVGGGHLWPVRAECPWCEANRAGHAPIVDAPPSSQSWQRSWRRIGLLYYVDSNRQTRRRRTVSERIEGYRPQLPSEQWQRIEEFVRQAVTDAEPDTTEQAADLLTCTTRLTLWAWQTAGLELERDTVFNRWTIEEFIARGCPGLTGGSRGTMRSRLFTVAERLLAADARLPRVAPLPSSSPSVPYTRVELVRLRSWANGQPTFVMRRDANVLLALGAGAGLATSDINRLHIADVSPSDEGVILNVTGLRPREVVLLAEWESTLLGALEHRKPGDLVFGWERTAHSPNSVHGFVARTHGHAPHLTAQRLRATWIVHHLTAGTPLSALMDAAGVMSLEAFTRYLRFVPSADTSQARQWLRGAGER
jgi:hypothetical protein